MKKTLLFMIFVFALSWQNQVSGQVPPPPVQIVKDPSNLQAANKNGIILSAVGASIEVLELAQQKLEKIKEAVDWIEGLTSVQDFIIIVETTTSMVGDLQENYQICLDKGLLDDNQSALSEFRYQINVNRLESATDFLNLLLAKGFSMERGERMKALETAMNRYVDSQEGFNKLNEEFKKIILEDYLNEEIEKEMNSFLEATISRYKQE